MLIQFFYSQPTKGKPLSLAIQLVPQCFQSRYVTFLLSWMDALLVSSDADMMHRHLQSLLLQVADAKNGKESDYDWFVLNAFAAEIRHNGVRIVNYLIADSNEATEVFTLEEFEKMIRGTVRFLEMPASLESRLIVEI
jgi:hypothetical protein